MWNNRNKRQSSGGLARSFGALALVAGLVVAAGLVGFKLLGSPFTTVTRDHSAPPVLLQLRKLADFHAAQAQFEVTIDQEKDVKWMPQFLAGERVQYIAVGTVDSVVDFSHLGDGAVTMSPDRTSVEIVLPPAYVTNPVLDNEVSHVMNRDRGLINRVGGMFTDNPTSEKGLVDAATSKIATAAHATDLVQRGEENTRKMLTAMLTSMGFTSIDVSFQTSTAGP